MESFLATDFVIKMTYLFFAFTIMRYISRYFDSLIGISFKEAFKEVVKDGKAFSLYASARLIAFAIIISSIF